MTDYFEYSKTTKTTKLTHIQTQKDVCAPMFTTALFTIAKIWKQPNKIIYMCVNIDTHIYQEVESQGGRVEGSALTPSYEKTQITTNC